MTPREQVFSTIRRSLGVTGMEAPRRAIVAQRLSAHAVGVVPDRTSGKSDAELVALFVEMAEAAAATVATVRSAKEGPQAIADYLRGHNLAPKIRRGGDARLDALPWDRTTLDVSVGRSFGDDLVGVSAAFGAVAETGTLIMVSGEDNPSTLNLLPDDHIVVLDAGDVSATYEDIWGRIRIRYGDGTMPRTVNWITGPSRSADIEQILLMGAHGPRRLHVVLIDPEAAADGAEQGATAPAASTPSPAVIRSTLTADGGSGDGGSADDKPDRKPDDKPKPEPKPAEKDDELDESLDDSFPASDPPSQTQP